MGTLRSFPSIALRIPTAHNFTRDQRARIRKWRLFLYENENDYGDLSFFFCCFELSSKFLYVK